MRITDSFAVILPSAEFIIRPLLCETISDPPSSTISPPFSGPETVALLSFVHRIYCEGFHNTTPTANYMWRVVAVSLYQYGLTNNLPFPLRNADKLRQKQDSLKSNFKVCAVSKL